MIEIYTPGDHHTYANVGRYTRIRSTSSNSVVLTYHHFWLYNIESKMILIMTYIVLVITTHGVELEVPQFVPNFYLSSALYHSITGVGLYGCARYCGLDTGCKSFTYNTTDLRCRLIEDDADTAPEQYGGSQGSIYGDRSAVISDESLMGACQNHNCPKYTSCVRLSSGSGVCIKTACGPTTENSHRGHWHTDVHSNTMTKVGVKRYLSCGTGYIGYRSVVCQESGNWSEPEDHCRDCGTPPSIPYAVISNGKTTIGSTRAYECELTTSASGPLNIECQQDGHWSNMSFECVPDCLIEPYIHNAYTTETVAPAGSAIPYVCDTGYQFTAGTGTRYCNNQGVWEDLDMTCDPVDCGPPTLFTGIVGIDTTEGYTYPSIATLYCGMLYSSSDPSNQFITCQSDGTWTQPQFTCIPL
ncbi:sushi, von Willebrand factor type A, EGF and pentraxin domain-containing protein 1-like [Argopecten irradians]|uniref:sushi, von Willebrand factor type A, EGF and pentraxin domain-containing protein 1-like n=1 Tax=Argopecten irradians TaxID=31199 RepID=UPI00371D9BF8